LERSMRLLSHFPKTDCGRREWTEWSRCDVDALGSGSIGFIEGVRTSSSAILPACRLSVVRRTVPPCRCFECYLPSEV